MTLSRTTKTSSLVFFGAFVFLLACGNVQADTYYSYEDDHGTVRFSDEPPDVPAYSIRQENVTDAFRVALKRYSKDEMKALIHRYSQQLAIEPALVEAIVKVESEYDSMAVSKRGARGLMQLMPETAKSLGVSDIHDPSENLQGGISYLKHLLDRFQGNVDLAIAAYNAGENAVARYNGIPPFHETIDYVNKVRKYYAHFVELASRSAFYDASTARPIAQ